MVPQEGSTGENATCDAKAQAFEREAWVSAQFHLVLDCAEI